jgi:hypothetical protein
MKNDVFRRFRLSSEYLNFFEEQEIQTLAKKYKDQEKQQIALNKSVEQKKLQEKQMELNAREEWKGDEVSNPWLLSVVLVSQVKCTKAF